MGQEWEQDNMEDAEKDESVGSADKDHDGKLSLAELESWESGETYTNQLAATIVNITDTDQNSNISMEELERAGESLMQSSASAELTEFLARVGRDSDL